MGYERLSTGELVFKRYYSNNQLELEVPVDKDSLYHGVYKTYYLSGKLENIAYFKHGIKDSIDLWYYESGVLEEKRCWKNKHTFGDQYIYHENGKLAIYIFTDLKGNNVYKRNYDKNGLFTQTQGQLYFTFSTKRLKRDSLRTGKSFTMRMVFPTPPDCNVKLEVGVKDYSKKNDVAFKSVPTNNRETCTAYYDYKHICSKPGKYRLIARLTLTNKFLDKPVEQRERYWDFEVKSPTDSLQ